VAGACGREAMKGRVEGAGGRPDDQVGSDAVLVQRAQHPHLDRPQARPTREDEGHLLPLFDCHVLFAYARASGLTSPHEVLTPGCWTKCVFTDRV
jgi:hypothetical protein